MFTKVKRSYLLIVFLFLLPAQSFAVYNKVQSAFNDKRERDRLEEIAEKKIAIHDKTPERAYEVIDAVRGHAILTQKNEKVYRVLKRKAYQMGADAILDVRCRKFRVGVSCQGTAVRFAD